MIHHKRARRFQHLISLNNHKSNHKHPLRFSNLSQEPWQEPSQRHWEQNKRLPHERIELLVDPGMPVLELSPLVGGDWKDAALAIGMKHHIPSGGIVTGIGVVSGKPCMMVANDATIKGGTSHADIANDDVEAVSCKQ